MRASIRARQLGRMQDESEKRMFEDVVWSTYTERVHQFQSGALRLYSQASKQNVSQTVTRPFLLTFQEDGVRRLGNFATVTVAFFSFHSLARLPDLGNTGLPPNARQIIDRIFGCFLPQGAESVSPLIAVRTRLGSACRGSNADGDVYSRWRQVSMVVRDSARLMKICSLRHSSRKRLSNDSTNAFCTSLPGAM